MNLNMKRIVGGLILGSVAAGLFLVIAWAFSLMFGWGYGLLCSLCAQLL